MTRTLTVTALTTALAISLPMAAGAAPSDPEPHQRDRTVKIDAKVQVQISRELQQTIREVTAGLSDMVVEITRDVTRDLTRDLGRELGYNLGRGLEREFGRERGWLDDQDRNWSSSADDRQTKTIAIGANGTLELENFTGDITVTVSSGKDVSVDIIRQSRGQSQADARTGLERVQPEVNVVGTRATVRSSYRDRPTDYSVSTDYVVRAPAGTRIVINSLRADIKVTGIKGEISATTASGDVVLTDVGVVREAKTANGDVVIRGSESDDLLDAGSLNGDISLTDVKARRVRANTVSGSVVARSVECESAALSTINGDIIYAGTLVRGGRYEFTSNSGDVRFTPSGSTGYALQATSFSGEITSAIALQSPVRSSSLTGSSRGPRRNTASAKVGDGSATVTLQTFSGDISIGKK
jgi:DUF4097 and DUF4098 domain-containing protein YvlB